jgi:hypothetical protein
MIDAPHAGDASIMVDSLRAERIGRNNATFRDANERIGATAAAQARPPEELLPFLCECAEPTCTELLQVALADYRRVRSDPRRFLAAPGHEGAAEGVARVVEEHAGYVVTEKVGRAAEIAERRARDGEVA